MKPRLFASLASLLFACVFAAPAATNEAWSVRVWQSDSLSDHNQVGLVQTDDGFLWMATYTSLVRFDGSTFQEFPVDSFLSQTNGRLRALIRGHDDSLLLAFESGPIVRLHAGSIISFTNLPAMVPQTLLVDAEGSLWLTCRNLGPNTNGVRQVCRIKDGTAKWFSEADGLPEGRYFLASDVKGQIWYACDGEIGMFRDGRFNAITNVESRVITRVTGATDGGVWFTVGRELFRFNPGRDLEDCGAIPTRNAGTRPSLLFADKSGALWIATGDDGLFRYQAGRFESIPSSDRAIFSLAEDREGNIWAGTPTGLNRLQPQSIHLEGAIAGLPSESVRSLCQDTAGTIWATTQDGLLAIRTNGAWRIVSGEMDLQGLFLRYLAADLSGGIWIGTSNRKLVHAHDGQVTLLGPEDGIAMRSITALLASRRGDLWVGGENPNGLLCLRAGVAHNVPAPDGLGRFYALEEDAAGDIWIGLESGNLLRARQGSMQVETISLPATEPRTVLCLHATADGSLWIGFKAGGLGRLKDGRFSQIGMEQGFRGNRISQIESDGLGNLWFGSDQGLFRVPQSALDQVADHRAESVEPAVYASGPELMPLSRDANGALRSRDGRLWIPMGMTLATIDPGKLTAHAEPPRVLLKRVTVDGRDAAVYGGTMPVTNGVALESLSGPLRLKAGARKLEFEFAALSFRAPENVHFRYQLDGFDEKWVEAGNTRSAAYSRLEAGRYRFHVTACNSDGVWNPVDTEIAISIAPFVWQQWWFRLLTVALFASALAAAVRYVSFHRLRRKLRAVEQQAALDKERARIARDIHDDLGGNLTKILLLTELTLRDRSRPDKSDKLPERVREISGTARQVMKSLDETVWAIDPRNDTLPDLIIYLSQFAVSFLQNADISCHVDVPDRPASRTVTADVRHELFLATKEALHNIVRHARATEVTLRIVTDDTGLVITIVDNGRGFAGSSDAAGADGLRNMRLRMRELGGDFSVQSVPGTGTTISLSCPWQRPVAVRT